MQLEQKPETTYRKKSFVGVVLLVVFISFLSFITVRGAFNLALGGDDWGIHYLIWGIFDIRKEASYFNPFTYFCTYCPHYFFLSIISRVFGYEPFYYFLASFVSRVIVALSLFYLLKKITKEILIAFLASCFFAVTYLGIEATDWAFNYNHILGIGILALFFVWYFKSKETLKFKPLIISALLFASALVVSPPRMHGIIPLILILELGWWFIDRKKFNFKMSGIRIVTMITTNYIILYGVSDLYFLIRDHLIKGFEIGPFFIGNGYGAKEWNTQRSLEGIDFLKQKFIAGQSDLIIDPIATLGNYILPDMLWNKIPFSQISLLWRPPFTFFSYILPISLVYGGLTYIVLYFARLSKKNSFWYILNLFFWMLFIYLLQKVNISTFSYPRVAFALVGGFTIFFSVWLFFLLKTTKPLIAHMLLLGLGWMFTSILFPWVISPYGIIFTWGRYSVQQGAGLAIWMAIVSFITIDYLNKKRRFFLLGITYLLIVLFIFMHTMLANDYLTYIATYRSKQIDTKFWDKITTEVPKIDRDGLNIFLLLTDPKSAAIAEAIRFGFYGRASIFYNTRNWDYSTFMVVNEYESILSSVYDGRYLIKQGRKPIPTTIDRVYAFALQNKEMYNVTEQIREKLKVDLEALKKGTLSLPQTFQ